MLKFSKTLGGAPLKKPPYRSYRRERREEKPSVQIPEKIDTPQAEQLVSDLYSLLHFLERYKKKILLVISILLLIGGVYAGYNLYSEKVELRAAELTDRGLYFLEKGEKNKAFGYFEKAAEEYGSSPSGRLAKFLLGKLKGEENYLKGLSKKDDYLLSPPSKTSLGAVFIDRGKLLEARKVLKSVKRDEWTHPEALYDEVLISLIEGNRKNAESYLDLLRGDYQGLPITKLAEELLR